MSNRKVLNFRGKNGHIYHFQVYGKNEQLPSTAALYAFMNYSNGEWHVLYIGQTIDLPERMESHHKWHEAERLGFNYLAVCLDVNLLMMDDDEKNLIQFYNPPCNEQLRQ